MMLLRSIVINLLFFYVMSKNNFKRSNVDVETLQVSAPKSSSFDLTKNDVLSIPFGKLYPVRCRKLMAGSLINGSISSDLNLENFATPMSGRMRLDQHVFVVSARRIFNDWRQWFEKGIQNSDSLPAVNLRQNAECYLINFGDIFDEFLSIPSAFSSYTHPNQYFADLINGCAVMCSTIAGGDLKTKGNLNDYWDEEYERLHDLEVRVRVQTTPYYMTDFIHYLLERVLGEGSIADNLGYDIYPYFSQIADNARLAEEKLWATLPSSPTSADAFAIWNCYQDVYADPANCLFSLGHICNFVPAVGSTYKTLKAVSKVDLDKLYILQCEDALRANYAVWYDAFRNWHIESSDSCLNPDNFTTQKPLIFEVVSGVDKYYCDNQLQLLAPRCRNWSRDMFTMIQPDDYYRHVQAPASNLQRDLDVLDNEQILFNDYVQSVYGTIADGFAPGPFPIGQTFGETSIQSSFLHDLQTMRRANMLENYLRANYYNPDTYVGQMEARYGIKPLDFALLTSQYIGGSEQMVQGSQLQANLGTSETPAGQRTFTANASSVGSFSYSVSDPSYLLSYVGFMPLVHYNARNASLSELKVQDQVIPEFADDTRIGVRSYDFLRGLELVYHTGARADAVTTLLGFTPRYYNYRHELDGVHGAFLREYRSYTWLRDSYSLGISSLINKDPITERVHLPLDCFAGKKPWDYIARGSVTTPLFVQCALPGKLEFV